ncbi:MAG: hypothetical protein IIB58_07215, partial [Planctomycetes bacterium]|nr:hypothetical protein [Planctomycetota bacterium]
VWHGAENYALALVNPHPHDLTDLVVLGYSIRIKESGNTFNLEFGGLPSGEEFYYAATTPINGAAGGKDRDIPGLIFNPGDTIQLIRKVPSRANPFFADIVVDEFFVPVALDPQSAQRGPGWLSTVPVPFATDADYAAYIQTHTLGSTNSPPDNLFPGFVDPALVHATGDHLGLESAYPTTGSMLLLMRHACKDNLTNNPAGASAFTGPLGVSTERGKVDNGHMPVFDQTQLAQVGVNPGTGLPDGSQPMDGTTLLSIPWGQLVFDYFTALPFDNQFDPLADPPLFTVPADPADITRDPNWPMNPDVDGDGDGIPARMDRGYAEYVAYLRANQPTVELGGVRVHGRININAAPWKVIDGLPLMHPQVMPIYKWLYPYAGQIPVPPINEWKWSNVLLDPNGGFPMGFDSFTPTGDGAGMAGPPVEKLGVGKAKGIVAYRELRALLSPDGTWTTGDYNVLSPPVNYNRRLRADASLGMLAQVTQRHTAGFLTVGELANVRLFPTAAVTEQVTNAFSQMDNGQTHNFVGAGAQNYLFAVAPLVALGDWVTVKGHTFTAYGVLTGQGEVAEVNRLAERFEMVFDRSNLLISDDPAERPEVIYKVREPLSEVNPN